MASQTASDIQNAQAQFIVGVSQQSGIDPRVVAAWVKQEGAYAANGTGGYNFLNLSKATTGNVGEVPTSKTFANFATVQDAIASTVNRLNQPFAAGIRASVGKTPQDAISAISASGWDKNQYGGPGGPNLQATFAGLFSKAGLTSAYTSPASAGGVANDIGSASDFSSYDATNLAGSAKTAADAAANAAKTAADAALAVPRFLAKITSVDFLLRAGEVIGGAVLVLVGLYLLSRQIGLASVSPVAAGGIPSAIREGL